MNLGGSSIAGLQNQLGPSLPMASWPVNRTMSRFAGEAPFKHQHRDGVRELSSKYVWKSAKTVTKPMLLCEVLVRLLMLTLALALEFTPAFERIIQVQEMHFYAYPMRDSLSIVLMMLVAAFVGYTAFFPAFKIYERYRKIHLRNSENHISVSTPVHSSMHPKHLFDGQSLFYSEIMAFTLALTLAMLSSALFVNTVKSLYGEPRPDYFSRCFPSQYAQSMETLGLPFTPDSLFFECEPRTSFYGKHVLMGGRKSFPSGHSSMICAMSFVIIWYVMERSFPDTSHDQDAVGVDGLEDVRELDPYKSSADQNILDLPSVSNHKKQEGGIMTRIPSSLKLLGYMIGILPVVLVLTGRSTDYRHHWNDIICGSIVGIGFGAISVALYFHSRVTRTRFLQIAQLHFDSTRERET